MKSLAIIPCRYASSRFPGKPLIDIAGKTMIRRVYEQSKKAKLVDEVIVATDDERIFKEVDSFGGTVLMTRSDHKSGTDRCAEIASQFPDYELVINVQGDEPFIQPGQIDLLIESLQDATNFEIGTMVKAITSPSALHDPNVVKVVIDQSDKALYFSRQIIPFIREYDPENWIAHHKFYKHIGMYIFRNSTLQKISKLPPGKLEQSEQLEQLRWMENGYSILTVETDQETFGIDTPEDLEKLQSRKL